MRAKSMVLIAIALGCGLVASIGISQVMKRPEGTAPETEMVEIYFARTNIDINEQLTADNVKLEKWPKDKVHPEAIQNLKDIKEKYAVARIMEGEPILRQRLSDSLSTPGRTIPEGYRVCSFKVRMDTAVSYLIRPGDRVDIIATFRRGRSFSRDMTGSILENVRLFAINSETKKEIGEDGQPIVAKTVSVLVKVDQVERLMLASELASLRLSLRPQGTNEEEEVVRQRSFVTIDELLNGGGSSYIDKKDPEPETTGDTGFGAFLNASNNNVAQPPIAPIEEEPEWEVEVLTADGAQTFVWHDVNRRPVEVFPDSPATPEPQPAAGSTVGSQGTGQPAAGAGAGGQPGGSANGAGPQNGTGQPNGATGQGPNSLEPAGGSSDDNSDGDQPVLSDD